MGVVKNGRRDADSPLKKRSNLRTKVLAAQGTSVEVKLVEAVFLCLTLLAHGLRYLIVAPVKHAQALPVGRFNEGKCLRIAEPRTFYDSGTPAVCSFQKCVEPGAECVFGDDCGPDEYCERAFGVASDGVADSGATDSMTGSDGGTCIGGSHPAGGRCLPKPRLFGPGDLGLPFSVLTSYQSVLSCHLLIGMSWSISHAAPPPP